MQVIALFVSEDTELTNRPQVEAIQADFIHLLYRLQTYTKHFRTLTNLGLKLNTIWSRV